MRRLFLSVLLFFWAASLCAQDVDTVHVCGIVTVGTDVFYAGSGVSFFMQNSESDLDSGVMAYCNNPELIPSLEPGDSICFTAIASQDPWPYEQMTEHKVIPETFELISSGHPVPEPLVISAAMLDSINGPDTLAEHYEACLVRIYDVTVDSVIPYTNTSSWVCHDSTSHLFVVREASDSIDYLPSVETSFYYVQGVVYHRFDVYNVQPAYMSDLGFSAYNDWLWHWPEQPVEGDTIYFYLVIPEDFEVVRADLGYRLSLGAWTLVPMDPVDDTLYNYILPPLNAGTRVDYYAELEDTNGNIIPIPNEDSYSFYVDEMQRIAQDEVSLPSKVTLYQNYPNPFNATTTISFNLLETSFISLKIYDLLGRETALLAEKRLPSGTHSIKLNCSDFTSGIYFYHLRTAGFIETKSMNLVK